MQELLKRDNQPLLKKESIVSDLRLQIVGGELSPGVQLPTRYELERTYGVSRDTVQRALDRLLEEEFVFTNGRRGTYVSKYPPHLSRYALVFATHPEEGVSADGMNSWSRFEEALYQQALQFPPTPMWRLSMYHGVGSTINGEDYRRLEQEVINHRLAGLIFAFDPVSLRNTPLMQDDRVARVAIVTSPTSVPEVTVSMFSFIDRALDFLAARGRRRVAVLSHRESSFPDNVYLASGVAARRMMMKRYWMQTANVRTAASADECVHLLMHPNQTERPDALIIDNDNLVEHAMRGLLAAGVRVPEDVEVVAHANFPLQTNTLPVPLTRLGFDIRQIFNACFESMSAQQQGKPVPSCLTVGAVFDTEVESEWPGCAAF